MMSVNFSHEKSVLSDALNLSKNDVNFANNLLIYSIMNRHYLANILYDNENEIPHNLISNTGSLEFILSNSKNDEMNLYCMINYLNVKKRIDNMLHSVEDIENVVKNLDDIFSDKYESLISEEKKLYVVIFMYIINNIKKANNSFVKFNSLMTNDNDFSKVDEILNNL